MNNPVDAIRAQAHLHHAYYLGLQLMVASRKGAEVMEEWTFRLFRRQHLEKFLPGLEKLGLTDLPHAVACAQYHVLANNIGGVGVEYMPESTTKAWLRFRYPRWMFHGPTLCGIPREVSLGILRAWYAHNGVSLKNPRLGFVCVSEDMTGEFGLCGYFKEYDHDLAEHERLQFAKDEQPPPFMPEHQPRAAADQWSKERLEKANRNYAMEYVRNGLCELSGLIGSSETLEIGKLSARLIGLQYSAETARMINAVEGTVEDAVQYLARMFEGMGDEITRRSNNSFEHRGLRVIRGLNGAEKDLVLTCWLELWQGVLGAQQVRKSATISPSSDGLLWEIRTL